MRNQSPFENCIMPLLEALQWDGGLSAVKEAMPHFSSIQTTIAFSEVMANLDFELISFHINTSRIDQCLLPALFTTEKKEIFVLFSIEDNQISIFNGNLNKKEIIDLNQFYQRFPKGSLYFFKLKTKKDGLEKGWFGITLKNNKGLLINALFLSFVLSILMLATPIFVLSVYDYVIQSASYSMLIEFCIGVFLALGGIISLYRIRSEHLSLLGAYFGKALSNQIMHQLLYLAPSYTETATIGAQIARVSDFDKVREFISGPMISILFDLPFIFVSLIFIGFFGKSLVFIPIGMIFLFILLFLLLSIKMNTVLKESSNSFSDLQEFLLESVNALRVIKYTGSIALWNRRYRKQLVKNNFYTIELSLYDAISNSLSEVIMISAGTLILVFGAVAVMHGNLPAGYLLAFMMIVWRILTPIKTIISILPRILQLITSVRQIDRLMGLQIETVNKRVQHHKIKFKGEINFNRVSMRYMGAYNPSLLGVSFRILPGSFIAITGRNGSGKSTILKLLLGLYQPQAGSILIDGQNISQLNPLDLRASIGYLPQKPELFYGTIEDNLRFGDPIVSEEVLRKAIQDAGILETILAMPDGFATRIYDQNQKLSDSFCQELCLARTYLRSTAILLLDEPANALDQTADKQLIKHLGSLKGKTTVIMITHRPSHLKEADSIFLMDQGQLVMQGPTQEVLEKIPLNLL